MSGWIKLHRSITDHWLYTEKRQFSKFEAWNDILLTVNFTSGKSIIKGKVILINRGESILSLESWGKRWSWNKSAVKRFFDLLKKDEMIELKNETVTTRLIVCNYDSYQSKENADETQVKRRRNADETQTKPIEEEEERKEEKETKFNFRYALISFGFKANLVDEWVKVRKTKKLTNSETVYKRFIKQVELNGNDKNEILERCIEKSWGGFESDWYKPISANSTKDDNYNHIMKQVKAFNEQK